MSIVATSDLDHAPTRLLLVLLTSAIACVALADWLFFDWDVGISLALFLGVLGVVAVASNGVRAMGFGKAMTAGRAGFVSSHQPSLRSRRGSRDRRN